MATIDSLANETLIDIMEMLKEPFPTWDKRDPTPGRHITEILSHPSLTLLNKLDLPSLPTAAPIEQASAVAAMAKACEERGIQWSMGGRKM
ncbi:hypothetical protein RQP46_003231 [Phenoliferia psychrophenolica]